ncbi:hypothetical protein [Bacteroides sp. 14(A)]|uniref:hypothetical protein n=1 Tax=Bacteroides sp. 14(A) TaxID=1163670 RepID=UPI0004B9EB5E|nr:hypothetical protein [Bacteroides sp. 14(A)]
MKKWTYLVAAGMLLGATPVFTGCIDNDEPAGIAELRGAKAELLKAKATVETAKAEQVKAKAAYLLAQAEYQKALAATENANAKIKEAIAKQEEAKVKLIETQNEQEKQKLQAQIAELEHQKEMWEIEKNSAIAAAEQAVKSWELAYKQAEVAYEKVLLELAAQKASLTKQQQLLLADYVNDVKTAKEDLAEKKEDVRLAQRAVNKAAQLVEETEADKEYWQYELARTLKLENKKLEGLEAALKEAKEGLGEFENMKPTELAAKYEALEQELNALKKKIADESVKAAEERRAIQEGELTNYYKKVQSMTENMQKDIDIPAFTYPEVAGDALPFAWNGLKDKEYEALTYKWINQDNYDARLNELQRLLAQVKQWTRDENDNEWTQQRIAEWKKQIEDENAAIEGLKKDWKEAVDVYHRTPADVVIDLSKITGYTEAVAAIKPFNTAVTDYQKAWTAFEDARKVYQKVTNEFWDNKNNINNTYYTEYYKLDPDTKANEERTKLYETWKTLKNDPDAEQAKIEEAWKAYIDFDYNAYVAELTKPLEEKRDKALKAEDTKRIEAENAVRTTVEAYKAKRDALIAEVDVVTPLYDKFYTNASQRIDEWNTYHSIYNKANFSEAAGLYQSSYENSEYISNWSDTDGNYINSEWIYYPSNVYTYEVDADAVTEISRESIKTLIKYRSQALFGEAYGFNYNPYKDPDARLLDLTFDDVKKLIEESSDEPLYGNDYINACRQYGKMGAVFALEAQVKFAEAWLADKNSSVNKLISATAEAIEAMETKYEEQKLGYEEQEESLEKELLAINEKLQAAVDALNELRATSEPIIDLKQAVWQAIQDYREAGFDEWSQDLIDREVMKLKTAIEQLDLAIEDQNHAIETAQRNLDGYNNGNLTALQTAKEALEDAEAAMVAAQEVYNDALDALNKMIAAMAAEVAE